MKQQKTRFDRIISRIKNNPVVASLIAVGAIIIPLSTFTDATKNLFSLLLSNDRKTARIELSKMSLQYAPETFVESAKKGDVPAVKVFLAGGMDPNATDAEGNTAMMYAAREGRAEIINALLKAKANVNKKNEGGATALSWAAAAGNIHTLRVLLDNGANAEAISDAFVTAAEDGQSEIMRILLGRCADVNRVGYEGLMHAAGSTIGVSEEQLSDAVTLLLDLGIEVNARNEEGCTPLLFAADRGHASVV